KRILDAAAKIFAAKGFDGASVSDIARRARVSKQLVHHHFRSKESLFEEVHDIKFRPVFEWQESMPERAADLFAERFRKRAKDLDYTRYLTWEAASRRALPLHDARQRRITDYGSAIRLMQADGKLPEEIDHKLLQLAILALSTYPMAFAQITRLVTGRAPTDPVFQNEWYAFLRTLGSALFDSESMKAPPHTQQRKSARTKQLT
ncbi:MAG: TetR/AcrR family transcriptional regulator, partial [Burkholderiales bacterium]